MAAQLVRITNEVEIPYLTYRGQPVLTFALIDKVHNRVEGTARKRFCDNRKRFIEGEDYFYLADSESLSVFRTSHPGILKDAANEITLITESGYLMLVKSFTDDLSWQIQRQLVKLYFRVKAMAEQPKPGIPDAQWREILTLIHAISNHCHFSSGAGSAVHERLRWIGGVANSRFLPPEQFEDAKREVAALAELAEQHFNRWISGDREFIEQVLRPPVSIRKVRALVRRQSLQPSLGL
ncbi:MAG: ORF6N domain-containing protein [Candidatus Contendobacter sp.]